MRTKTYQEIKDIAYKFDMTTIEVLKAFHAKGWEITGVPTWVHYLDETPTTVLPSVGDQSICQSIKQPQQPTIFTAMQIQGVKVFTKAPMVPIKKSVLLQRMEAAR